MIAMTASSPGPNARRPRRSVSEAAGRVTTMSLTTGAAVVRCPWGDDPAMTSYHDTEWGKVLRGDRELFERMSLEAFQSGLSWAIILRKRDRFREVFRDFDPEA